MQLTRLNWAVIAALCLMATYGQAGDDSTKGEITATVGGQALQFTELLADDNYVIGTGFGLLGTHAESGARLQIGTMFQTLTLETELPWEVRAETMQEAMDRRATGDRSPPKTVFVRYTDSQGREYYDSNPSLTITAFDGATVAGTITASLQEKKGEGRLEVTDGAFEVRVKSPFAAKAVETAVGDR
jgi:hypothetical protein